MTAIAKFLDKEEEYEFTYEEILKLEREASLDKLKSRVLRERIRNNGPIDFELNYPPPPEPIKHLNFSEKKPLSPEQLRQQELGDNLTVRIWEL